MMTLTVLVPVYNEQETILKILDLVAQQREPLKSKGVALEVVVVNDGSIDNTSSVLSTRPDLYATFVNLKKNQGKGGAVREGLKVATGDYVLFQDADLEYDPSEYSRLIGPVVSFQADIVMGSRMLAPQCTRVHYYWNKIGNRFITWILNVLYNKTFTDIYTCYFLFRRNLIDPNKLATVGFEQQAEILCKALRCKPGKNRIIYEVPISYHGRTYEEGKKIRAYHIFSVIWAIIRFRIF